MRGMKKVNGFPDNASTHPRHSRVGGAGYLLSIGGCRHDFDDVFAAILADPHLFIIDHLDGIAAAAFEFNHGDPFFRRQRWGGR